MEHIVFRNDDVCANTDIILLNDIYRYLNDKVEMCSIVSGVTPFSRANSKGTVYLEVPFKDKPTNWFYDVDSFFNLDAVGSNKVASHGLFHIDHSKVSRETQEMSILGSCNYLNTDLFIAPFNRYNQDTIDICKENGIDLLQEGREWRSLDFQDFNPNHKYWYFHSWKFDFKSFKEKIEDGYILQEYGIKLG